MLPNIHRVASTLAPALLKAAFIALAAGPLVVAGGCSFMNGPTAKGPKSASAQHASGSPLTVESRNGSVEIVAEASRSDVQISATFTCAGNTQEEADQRLAQAVLVVSRDTSRALVVKPVFPGGARGNDGASLVIRIPDADGVNVTTSNGRVEIASVKGALVVVTSNGSVEVVNHDGSADITSSNGSVVVNNLAGDLQVQTSNASVDAAGVTGKTTIGTSNGAIDLTLDPTSFGPVALTTSNNSIDVVVGSAFNGDVSLDTSNGSLKIAGDGVHADRNGKNSAVVHLGSGGAKSTVKTSNGGVDFRVDK